MAEAARTRPAAPVEPAGATGKLLAALRDPVSTVAGLPAAAWSTLLRTARAANLLGTLAERLHAAGVLPAEAQVARHLHGARRLAERQRLSVRWEARCLHDTLAPLGVPVLLLKGAAYVLAPEAPCPGRMFGDIDLLVPRQALAEVESTLMLAGWVSAKADPYDQRYYRQWMHELPPMVHLHRGTTLDLHHTLLPPTGRLKPDPGPILDRARPVDGLPSLRVPVLEDLVIHSLVHLVHEGELPNGLRDLADVDAMVGLGAADPGFWSRLSRNAADNDLAGPVAFGLTLAQRWLGTAVPQAMLAELGARGDADWRRPRLHRSFDLGLTVPGDALDPGSEGRSWRHAAARQHLYLRAHALRMPWPLLLRHLSVKAWKGLQQPAADTPPTQPTEDARP